MMVGKASGGAVVFGEGCDLPELSERCRTGIQIKNPMRKRFAKARAGVVLGVIREKDYLGCPQKRVTLHKGELLFALRCCLPFCCLPFYYLPSASGRVSFHLEKLWT